MSVVIKGLEIPEDGYLDVRILSHGGLNSVTWNDLGCCPYAEAHDVVALPEKHGRLLDENDVIDAIHARLRELQTHKAFIGKHGDIDLLGVLSYIANIKAVVEAEGEDG